MSSRSAPAISGFDRFYFFFDDEDSRDALSIPHNLRILDDVFGCKDGDEEVVNRYWSSASIGTLIAAVPACYRTLLNDISERIRREYRTLSAVYQAQNGSAAILLP
ncbi:MAG: hypothetical protein AAF493_20400 [Pseudomonadota bacterium]